MHAINSSIIAQLWEEQKEVHFGRTIVMEILDFIYSNMFGLMTIKLEVAISISSPPFTTKMEYVYLMYHRIFWYIQIN